MYTLTEAAAPSGYHGMEEPLTFTLNSDGTVSAAENEYVHVPEQEEGEMVEVIIKNKPFEFKAIKTDENGAPLEGAHFALYREVTVGGTSFMDFDPIPGYEDIVSSAESGILPGISEALPSGTYYLKETAAPEGYRAALTPIRFTITQTGTVTAQKGLETTETTSIVYTLKLENKPLQPLPTGVKRTGTLLVVLLFGAFILWRQRKTTHAD